MKVEIDKLIDDAPSYDYSKVYLLGVCSIIDSLQQEQPEGDLKAETEMEWDSFNKHVAEYGEESEEVVWLNWLSFVDIANWFYELGLNARKV